MATVVTFTSAPADYDGFGTETIAIAGTDSRGREIRKVATPARHVDWQRNRYWSGAIYLVADEAEWAKLAASGLVTLSEAS